MDAYGNLLTQQIYNYGPPGGGVGSLARTYTNSYLGSTNYTNRYIYNRLAGTTVTDGTNTATLVNNGYDTYSLTNITGMTQHDSAYTTSFTYRGNATSTTTPTSTTIRTFDIGGNVVTSKTNGVTTTTNTSTNSSTNYAAPGTLTTNSLTSSLQWSSFLGVTQATGPNGDVASMIDDASRAALPIDFALYGAVTHLDRADSASPRTPGHAPTMTGCRASWTVSGRTVRAVTGYTSGSTNTTVSTSRKLHDLRQLTHGKVSQSLAALRAQWNRILDHLYYTKSGELLKSR